MIRDDFSEPAALKEATAHQKQNMPFRSVVSCNLICYEHLPALRCPTLKSVYKRVGTVNARTAESLHRRHGPHHHKMENKSNAWDPRNGQNQLQPKVQRHPETHELLPNHVQGSEARTCACLSHFPDQLLDGRSWVPSPGTNLATTLGR